MPIARFRPRFVRVIDNDNKTADPRIGLCLLAAEIQYLSAPFIRKSMLSGCNVMWRLIYNNQCRLIECSPGSMYLKLIM
jgi:hypothetical protein